VTKEAYLYSVHPKVTVEEVRNEVSWDLKVAPEVKTTEPPTVEEVRLIRMLDASKIYIGDGLKSLSFDKYMKMMEDSYDIMKQLY